MKKPWVICLLALIVVAVVLAAWLVPRSPEQIELEAYKQELIAKGEKLGKENWLPPPRQGSNGAALLVETLRQFSSAALISGISQYQLITNNHAKVVWRYDLHEFINSSNIDIWNAFAEIARTNQSLYLNVMKAVHAEYVDVPYDYATQRFPVFTNSQGMTRWLYPSVLLERVIMPLSAHSLLKLRQNRPDEACDELESLLEVVQKTCCEPNPASLDCRAGMVKDLCQTTWQFLQYTNLPEARLRQLQMSWEQVDIFGTVEPAFALQRAYVEEREAAARRKLSLWHKSPKELLNIVSGLIKHYNSTKKVLHLEALLLRQSYTNQVAQYRSAQAEVEAARSFCHTHAAAGLKKPSQVLQSVVNAETERQLAIAAIALERYYLTNGRYPQSLAELQPTFVKEAPVDFMDGKPLRYKPDPDGRFLLYSVGWNGHDDGGKGWPKKKKMFPAWDEGQDMVWPDPATADEVAARAAALEKPRTAPKPR